MLNIASVNMPKINPETKVLIIKNLKSKSPAEVADILNVSKREVERIRKRYPDPGQADHARQLLETTACCRTSQLQDEWTPAMPVLSRTERRIFARNGLYGRIAGQKPTQNKRQLRNRQQKIRFFQMNRQLSSIPSAANI